MPRGKRIDFSGVVHHVIARGIERSLIFKDDRDRNEFLSRLENSLNKTGCRCYAWVLMGNHFHLLIRTGFSPLSDCMRKLMTSYAVYFNRRHHRSGHLFQNRYKSILCQEDAYFLELVRYIHLNPVRAKMIQSIGDLDRYPWTGHSVLMGRKKREFQSTSEVISRFGRKQSDSRKKYRRFIMDGWNMGHREDLVGGGLQRSAGGWKGLNALRKQGIRWNGDERILGDGDFVAHILKETEECMDRRETLKNQGWTIEKLSRHVCQIAKIEVDDLLKKGRGNALSAAKGLFAYWGNRELGISQKKLAEYLQISGPALSCNVTRGERFSKEKSIKLLN